MNLIDKLKLNVINSSTLRLQAFESSFTQEQRRCVQLQLSSLWNKTSISITAFESNNSYTTHPAATPEISQFAHQKKLKLADPPDNSSLPIELLIGGDYYWRIVTTESPIMLSESFVMVPSMFGWILSGSRTHATIKDNTSVHQVSVQVSTDCLNDQVRCLWELDSIGIQDIQKRRMSARDEEILSKFYNDYEIEDNRRIVSLTWKSMITPSPNLFNAESRFHSLQKRLASNDDLKTQYNKCMLNYIEQKHVEVCPTKELNDKPMHYLPHHAVKKKTQTETKWRIVFDASSHDPGMPSLNDTLEAGPNLLPEIVGCLLRFRKNEFAVTCDGKQAFLQLILHKKDRDFTRFLWYKLEFDSSDTPNFTNEIIVYRFTRLPFGLTCSPFLLCAATRELARNHITDFPIAAPLIDKHLYMDDFLASTETESHIMILYHEIENLMTRMKLSMEKWATNSLKLKRVLDTTKKHHKSTTVLGIDWDTNDDTLGNTFKTFLCVARDKPLTKRWLLRCIASCYDPLGLFTPFTIIGKIIFQDTWILGIKWDELLPTTLSTMWYTAMKQLDDIASIKIPRYIGISSNIPYAVHVFCDASERAYGSVLYIVTQSNVHIVCSRNRLAPIKKVTLPRLELLAALMGTRLLKYFCTEVDIQPSAITLWTDSKITLSWIRSDPNKWKTFVCNRTTEILQNTSPAQWRHCPGIQNPADHLSRGILPSKLSKLKNWWYGPHWLTQEPFLWPKDDFSAYDQLKTDSEARKPLTQSLCVEITNPVIDITHYSSYTKLLRVTAWVLRFCHYCKNGQRLSSELTAMELQKATDYWILKVQQQCFHAELEALKNNRPLPKTSKIARFNPFLKNNQIRLGGRLQFAPLSANIRHPLLLEGNHPFVLLLIKHTHVRLHHLGTRIVLSDLRSKFWILRGRQAIKQVLHKCLPCKLSQSKQGNQIEGPLPTERVTPSAPFSTTGIDFAGPLYVRNKSPSDIAYIALFTCAITRALHIELVSDLSTDKFLLALQRFVGRRGLPYTIYTDNASTFHAANKELILLWKVLTSEKVQQFYAHNGIHWKFIVPRAAWWGGWWERLIGLTKRCLRKAVGRALLDIEGLSTVLIGVEAALNSRPLVFEDGNEDSIEALTPAHFLTGKKLTAIPTNPENDEDKLTQLYKKQQDILDTFWKRWSNEYLLQLRSFHHVNGHPSPPNLHLGDVVLLQEDVRPRHVWKKGRIKKLIAGRDGKVRSCILRAGGKDITRPVQLIIPLEIDQGGEDVTIR